MRLVSKIANYQAVDIYAPFLHLTKCDIVKIGKKLGVPYEDTWTCYKGRSKACGKCGACVEREEAIAKSKLCSE